jgi:glutamyl-Q tRNA(Asp) synthetase
MASITLPRLLLLLFTEKRYSFLTTNYCVTIFMDKMASRGQMSQYIALPNTVTVLPQANAAPVITRFAPSPNGFLHMGHALSAISAHDFARAHKGQFLLRIEDIDGTRSRIEHRQAILADMQWLGLQWDGEVIYQSLRIASYHNALEQLKDMGLVYPCVCTRGDILAVQRRQPVPHGPDGPVYPGTCRNRKYDASVPCSWRLDMRAACAKLDPVLHPVLQWHDLAAGPQIADPALFGDVMLWRKDAPASYHLAATLDDAADGVTHVVRGQDLFAYTAVHIVLQKLLGLLQPLYWHHRLFADISGEKLGKSRNSSALSVQREAGEDGMKLTQSLRESKLPLGISLL